MWVIKQMVELFVKQHTLLRALILAPAKIKRSTIAESEQHLAAKCNGDSPLYWLIINVKGLMSASTTEHKTAKSTHNIIN